MHVTQEMYRATDTTVEDVDGFIDYARSIEGVLAAALVGELPDGRIKASFRSNGAVKVNSLAADFGGGGHAYASGCLMKPPLKSAKEKAVSALLKLTDAVEGE